MKLICVSVVMFLIMMFISSVHGQSNFEGDSDEQLYNALSATCYERADLAATEFLKRGERVIPFLLSKKGDKKLFFGTLHRSLFEVSQIVFDPTNDMENNKRLLKSGDLRSMEVATLFLINAIFHELLYFSQTPNLYYETSEGYPKVGNKAHLIKKAWKAVDKWAIQLKSKGLAELQRQEIAPLDLERDGVDFH